MLDKIKKAIKKMTPAKKKQNLNLIIWMIYKME